MSDTTIIELERLTCATCGVVYGVPDYLRRRRANEDEPVHCPSGHENFYKSDKEIEDEESLKKERDKARAERDEARREQQALKERIIQLRGQLDQAEAYAADGRPVPPQSCPPLAGPSSNVEDIPIATIEGRCICCPHCDKKYHARGSFMSHLTRVHRLSGTIAGKIAYPEANDAAPHKAPPSEQ
jgi:hypothetical protein